MPKRLEGYIHDKLIINDIKGTAVNTYTNAKYKKLEGRNYMEIGDIEKTSPN